MKFMDEVANSPTTPPSLYMNTEGGKFAYDGKTGLFQIRVASPQLTRTVVLDIKVLGAKAFETAGRNGTTLRKILESPKITRYSTASVTTRLLSRACLESTCRTLKTPKTWRTPL